MMEFIPVVNVTKDVSIEIDIQEVKFVNDHRYMFKHTGKFILVRGSGNLLILVRLGSICV